LEHADRFDPNGQPRAWLQGIAANLIKRRQAKRARLNRREPLVRDLYDSDSELISDEEIFDYFATLVDTTNDPSQMMESDEAVSALLEGIPPNEQRVLQLAIVTGLDGKTLARELGISPGAARVRLHRALNNLRHIMLERR
jgi:RNA polymerase sigma-70 factor (ECF subfamily)